MPHTPRIGITVGTGPAWGEAGRHYLPYAAAVREAGGAPVRLAPGDPRPPDEILAPVAGLLFSGGRDVHPIFLPGGGALSEEAVQALVEGKRLTLDLPRDRLELALARAALAADRPLLGICRGCQLVNVALGGQLVLDIPSEVPGALVHTAGQGPEQASATHTAEITPESRLAAALGFSGRQPVNSRHHQAVAGPLPGGAVMTASCPDDGIIEAIEVPAARWVLAVQWHPERPDDPEVRARYRPLFEAFVAACQEAA